MKEGRPRDLVRDALQQKYGLSYTRIRHMSNGQLTQILCCPTEEARKVLLGIREPIESGTGQRRPR